MRFYSSKNKKWIKHPIVAIFHFIRDFLVFIIPVRRLPRVLVKWLYGVEPQFVFFVHPRRTEDIYKGFPPAVFLRRMLKRSRFLRIFSLFPPFVLTPVYTPLGINGLVVSSPFLPEKFFANKKEVLIEAVEALRFAAKLLIPNGVFGLGALWPMVTRRGAALLRYANKFNIRITNGHCGTLLSLFLMIQKMASLASIPLDELKIAILGVGKMGANLARVLYGKVAALTLIDINEKRLEFVENKLREVATDTDIYKYTNKKDVKEIKKILSNNHIIVCTVSSVNRILLPEDIPENSIIIDDSRPEGIPRDLGENKIVIEGGLLRIKELVHHYDFGFGADENVFGCLAESYMLAADNKLKPTVSAVDLNNFLYMSKIAKKLYVEVGDFKSRERNIKDNEIITILQRKALASTIPYKYICWIFNIKDV